MNLNSNGKTIVIKCGGAAITDAAQMHSIMQDIAVLSKNGLRIIIVHGGGPDISAMCNHLQLPTQFLNGQRITDANTMNVVQMVLLGKTNTSLVTTLNQCGVKAVGISGHDAAFLQAKKLIQCGEIDLGFVGEVACLDTTLINTLLAAGFTPVIAPVGVDEKGQAYNINADIAAGAIAGALGAEKLIMLSDVNGFYTDLNNPKTRLSNIQKENIINWLQKNKIVGGMVPKLQACLHALDQGVRSVQILDGKIPNSLQTALFTNQDIGTLITC